MPYSLLLSLFAALPGHASEEAVVPVHVFYQQLGTESRDLAETKGKRELDSGNPCVLKMKKEAADWSRTPAFREVTEVVLRDFLGENKPSPHLSLHYRNDSIELHYELRSRAERSPDGWVYKPERVVYRKGVMLTTKNGSWKDRLKAGQCRITQKNTVALADELNEAEWLRSCKSRKSELLLASRKVNNYLNAYVPPAWVEEAKATLWKQDIQIGQLLRENVALYQEGNDTSRNCLKGLELLEREAANTVAVLNEIKFSKKERLVLPGPEITELASRLQDPGDAGRMPASIRPPKLPPQRQH